MLEALGVKYVFLRGGRGRKKKPEKEWEGCRRTEAEGWPKWHRQAQIGTDSTDGTDAKHRWHR